MNVCKVIKKCQNGNKESFNELISYYYPYVLKYLMKIVDTKDIVEDIVQETFIKMINNIERFDIKGSATFETYLITIAKNTYIDYLRKNKKEFHDDLLENISLNDNNNYEENERYGFLLGKIEELPDLQKEAIKLKYLNGYSLEEIGARQNVDAKTVKSRLFEARKKLKKYMKGYDLDE